MPTTESQKRYELKYPWIRKGVASRNRCNNPNDKAFKSYGGRGIKYKITFEELETLWHRDRAYLMKKPSIDRIDNDGDYCFKNCRFIEFSENVRRSRIGKVARKREIFQFSKDNKFIKKYDSIRQAERELGILHNAISACAQGRSQSCGGFIWRYEYVVC